jgi:hypothetical protein
LILRHARLRDLATESLRSHWPKYKRTIVPGWWRSAAYGVQMACMSPNQSPRIFQKYNSRRLTRHGGAAAQRLPPPVHKTAIHADTCKSTIILFSRVAYSPEVVDQAQVQKYNLRIHHLTRIGAAFANAVGDFHHIHAHEL